MAAIFDFNGRGRLGRERNLCQGRRTTAKHGRWINERELITFARPNETAVLQAIKAQLR